MGPTLYYTLPLSVEVCLASYLPLPPSLPPSRCDPRSLASNVALTDDIFCPPSLPPLSVSLSLLPSTGKLFRRRRRQKIAFCFLSLSLSLSPVCVLLVGRWHRSSELPIPRDCANPASRHTSLAIREIYVHRTSLFGHLCRSHFSTDANFSKMAPSLSVVSSFLLQRNSRALSRAQFGHVKVG